MYRYRQIQIMTKNNIRIEILVVFSYSLLIYWLIKQTREQQEQLTIICNIFRYRNKQCILRYTLQIFFQNMLAHKTQKGSQYLGLFQMNQTVNWGGKFHTKKESLSLPPPPPPTPFLVCSLSHEYWAQITNRLNKVFSLPLEQRPFWRSPRGGTCTQNEQQRNPPSHLLSCFVSLSNHSCFFKAHVQSNH